MEIHRVPAHIEAFTLPAAAAMDAVAVIPTVRSTWLMAYGEHAWYVIDCRTQQGFCVRVRHRDIILPGLARFVRSCSRPPSLLRCLGGRFHYGLSFPEQIMLMTVPHAVTDMGDGRFLINLWSYGGFLVLDTRTRTVLYHLLDDPGRDQVLGSQQWLDRTTGRLHAMAYSLPDSIARIRDPGHPVAARIFTHALDVPGSTTVWEGPLSDYLHDIAISQDGRHGVACELGMYRDAARGIIPSRVLFFEPGGARRHWIVDRFLVAAHAQFDPRDPDVVYVSNHHFTFRHTHLLRLLKRGAYHVRFHGPATIFKYHLGADGPQEVGSFTRPDFYRLTNQHPFVHQDRVLIAATGFPDRLHLIDARTMRGERVIHVRDGMAGGGPPAVIGTMAPSPCGTRLLVQTTRTFQIIDLASGEAVCRHDWGHRHTCSNHMIAVRGPAPC